MKAYLVGAEMEENLSIRYLAASLRASGHEAAIVPFDGVAQLEEAASKIMQAKPGMVGLSMVNQLRAAEFYALAERLRALGYRGHITAGGHFPTFTYEEMLSQCQAIDSIVRHEGDATIVDLASGLESGGDLSTVAGLVFRAADGAIICNPRRQPEPFLDKLPFPARDGSPRTHLGVPTATIVGSRGCYGNCSFCCINAWHKDAAGPKCRLRSPENLVAEMASLYHDRGIRIFIFHDDNFFLPKREASFQRIREIGDLMRRHGLSHAGLVVKCRPNDVDREVFAYLKELGLIRVYVGIENNSSAGLRTLNRRVSVEDNHRALSILRALDIYACFNVLIFDPETTLGDIKENVDFLREHDYFPFNFCRTEAYAHTPIQQRLLEEGRLRGNYLAWDYDILDPRAELLFRICAVAFWERNFEHDGLANRNMGLAYQSPLLERFYPSVFDPSVRRKSEDLTKRINQDTLQLLEKAYRFAGEVDLEDSQQIVAFAARLATEVNRGNLRLGDEITRLEGHFASLAQRRPWPKPIQRSARLVAQLPKAAAPASLASLLLLAACTKTPPVVDPVAPPTTTASPTGLAVEPTTSPTQEATAVPVDPLSPPTFTPSADVSPTATTAGKFAVKVTTEGYSESEFDNKIRFGGWRVQVDLTGPDAEVVGTPAIADAAGYLREEDIAISPNGRHIIFIYAPAVSAQATGRAVEEGPDTVEVTFQVRRDGVTTVARGSVQFYVYPDGGASVGPEKLTNTPMVVDCVPHPTPVPSLGRPVVVVPVEPWGQSPSDNLGLTPLVRFTATLSDDIVGDLASPPEVVASAGTVSHVQVATPGQKLVYFDYAPPTQDGRLVSGEVTIKVSFNITSDGKPFTFSGEVRLNVDADGNIIVLDSAQSLLEPSATVSAAAASLPLGRRFGLDAECRNLGEGRLEMKAVISGVDATGLRYRWTSDDGKLSATDQPIVIWEPVAGGGHQQIQLAVASSDGDLVVVSRDVVV